MLEKSDCAVEVGEGRAQLGENIVGIHMLLTRAGIRMSQCSAVCVKQLQSS